MSSDAMVLLTYINKERNDGFRDTNIHDQVTLSSLTKYDPQIDQTQDQQAVLWYYPWPALTYLTEHWITELQQYGVLQILTVA